MTHFTVLSSALAQIRPLAQGTSSGQRMHVINAAVQTPELIQMPALNRPSMGLSRGTPQLDIELSSLFDVHALAALSNLLPTLTIKPKLNYFALVPIFPARAPCPAMLR